VSTCASKAGVHFAAISATSINSNVRSDDVLANAVSNSGEEKESVEKGSLANTARTVMEKDGIIPTFPANVKAMASCVTMLGLDIKIWWR